MKEDEDELDLFRAIFRNLKINGGTLSHPIGCWCETCLKNPALKQKRAEKNKRKKQEGKESKPKTGRPGSQRASEFGYDKLISRMLYKMAAKSIDPCDIDRDYLKSIWTDVCPILGIELFVNTKQQDNSYSIDRIDPSVGYIKGNVQIISSLANRIKTNATPEQVLKVGQYMVNLERARGKVKD